jgi:hypothetical protein
LFGEADALHLKYIAGLVPDSGPKEQPSSAVAAAAPFQYELFRTIPFEAKFTPLEAVLIGPRIIGPVNVPPASGR